MNKRTSVLTAIGVVLALILGAGWSLLSLGTEGIKSAIESKTGKPILEVKKSVLEKLGQEQPEELTILQAQQPAETAADELEAVLAVEKEFPLVVADCFLDSTAGCFINFNVNEDQKSQKVLTVGRPSQADQKAVMSLLYGDEERLLTLLSIDDVNQEESRNAGERLIGGAESFNISPLVVSIFARMIDNNDYGFVAETSRDFSRRLRDYFDFYHQGKDSDKRVKKFTSTEQAVIERLKIQQDFSAAEKSVLTLGTVYFDRNFVSLFSRKWENMKAITQLDNDTVLTFDSKLDVDSSEMLGRSSFSDQTTPGMAVCQNDILYRCELDKDRLNCGRINGLEYVCRRPLSPMKI